MACVLTLVAPPDCFPTSNTQKTSLVLSALQRQQKSISYYALDVSCAELTRNLHDLTQHFSPANLIKCHGLLGTYEDGISWLKSHLDCSWISVTIVWLGNSIGNLTRSEASGFLARVRSCTNMVNLQFIIGIDGCRDEGQIEQCYNPANPATQNFLLNGLDRANNVLGGPCFQLQHWTCKGSYDKQQRVWQQHYVAEKSMQFKVADSHVRIDKGEKILAIRTAKWIEDDVNLISENAGLEISRVWKTKEKSYGTPSPSSLHLRFAINLRSGVYLLRPSLNNGDDC